MFQKFIVVLGWIGFVSMIIGFLGLLAKIIIAITLRNQPQGGLIQNQGN